MALPKQPDTAIFSVVVARLDTPDSFRERLGTAFFIHLDGTFMTARHVLDPARHALQSGEAIAGVMWNGGIQEIAEIRLCPDLDIAVGKIDRPQDIVALALPDSDPAGNSGLIS